MQQFQVPQFIDIEDKIFGPLTTKQFIYILGGSGILIILWALRLPPLVFWPLAMAIGSFFASLAFLKINGQPFVLVLNNAINHVLHTRLYVWRRSERKPEKAATAAPKTNVYAPRLTQSKLKDLSWSLDISNKIIR